MTVPCVPYIMSEDHERLVAMLTMRTAVLDRTSYSDPGKSLIEVSVAVRFYLTHLAGVMCSLSAPLIEYTI